MTISTRSSRLPEILASSTLSMPSILSRRSRANCCSVRSGTSPDRLTISTGNRLKLTSWTEGSSASSGNSALAMSTLLRTSFSAFCASKPASNSSTTEPPPW